MVVYCIRKGFVIVCLILIASCYLNKSILSLFYDHDSSQLSHEKENIYIWFLKKAEILIPWAYILSLTWFSWSDSFTGYLHLDLDYLTRHITRDFQRTQLSRYSIDTEANQKLMKSYSKIEVFMIHKYQICNRLRFNILFYIFHLFRPFFSIFL